MSTASKPLGTALYDWALRSEGSTRTAGLVRIGLAITVWTRWANELLLFRHLSDGRWPMCVVFFVSTSLLLAGLWTRLAAPLAALSTLWLVYYVGYVEGHENYTHHHTTLLCWAMVWLALTPCGASYSVDRWLALRKAERTGSPVPAERGNLWGLRLMALQVASLYLWTAIDKCNAGFLSGARLAHYVMKFYSGSSIIDEGLGGVIFMLVAWGTVALEFSLAFGLFFKRTRNWLVLAGLFLHGVFYVLLDVSTFSVTMWVMYLAFYDADDFHRWIDRMHGYTAPVPVPAVSEPKGKSERPAGNKRARA